MNYILFWAIKVIHFDLVKNNVAALKNERLAKIWNLGKWTANAYLQTGFAVRGLKVSDREIKLRVYAKR